MVETLAPIDRNARPSSPAVEPFPTRRSIRAAELAQARTGGSAFVKPAKRSPAAIAAPAYADPAKKRTGLKSVQHRIVGVAAALLVPGLLIGSSIPASAFGTATDGSADVASAADPQSLIVDTALDGSALGRDTFDATTTKELAAKKQAALAAAAQTSTSSSSASSGDYSTVTPRAAGDDYPYRNAGGLSPMGYVIRQCTDFVAWRLNRDAGYTHDYKYVWGMMTPGGGSAYAWANAWRHNGWKTSHTPVKGSVAWFNGNHVAYVKAVHGGQVDLEEYNWGGDASYHTRTIDASDVALFLYPPP